ncbi:uroporphyrinogen-III synthase [Zunongwangia endophytica]|uniref:Uroporphyrinogen-III synthase n=1 Tax=Zunongwangia endophytica TaxID=1808945 RepID=A0ABV8H7C8_9FLAO|nr:uroporphyrinogen-III synthase [Zunongwangia endophytica]MDN3595838.1 uroporphyrinogen-III synthase [Zunongwangia endophytica]
MATVLSTKKLSVSQKQLLLGAKMSFVEYDAIKIEKIDIATAPPCIENAIITSKNAFLAIKEKVSITNAFVVGSKTASLLQENNIQVLEIADNASELAEKIIENHQNKHFVFFCGNKRRDELPIQLSKKEVSFEEFTVYKTKLNYAEFKQEFDGVLFFSPSGVESFFSKNKIGNAIAFCIGSTTAEAVKKYTENIKIATQPSIENVIVQVVKKYN